MPVENLLKTKTEYKNLKKQETQDISIKNELDKAWFQDYVAYGDFKDLPRRTEGGYQRGPTSMVYTFLNKQSSGANASGGAVTCAWSEMVDRQDKSVIENKIMPNPEVAKELHKPVIRKFKNEKYTYLL